MQSTRDYLLKYGIRPSVQRIAVMNYLMTHFTHPTVDEIYLALIDDIPTLSRTTVYNTLKLLVGHGAVAAIDIDRQCERFDADISLHAHFMCDECGCITDIPVCDGGSWRAYAPQGSSIRSMSLNYKGICDKCNALKTNEVKP